MQIMHPSLHLLPTSPFFPLLTPSPRLSLCSPRLQAGHSTPAHVHPPLSLGSPLRIRKKDSCYRWRELFIEGLWVNSVVQDNFNGDYFPGCHTLRRSRWKADPSEVNEILDLGVTGEGNNIGYEKNTQILCRIMALENLIKRRLAISTIHDEACSGRCLEIRCVGYSVSIGATRSTGLS